MILPQEVIDEIFSYLPCYLVVELQNEYAKKRVFNNLNLPRIWTCRKTPVLEWLMKYNIKGATVSVIDLAAADGNLDVIKWLTATLPGQQTHAGGTFPGCMKDGTYHSNEHSVPIYAMQIAAFNGDLEMVKWLHENRSEGCSKHAMTMAAGKGHLHVLKWLHENRTEGCTYTAIDWAAEEGHLDVIKWLYEHWPVK